MGRKLTTYIPEKRSSWLTGRYLCARLLSLPPYNQKISRRVLRDDPSKSDMHNREGLKLSKLWKVIKDWRMWPIYALGLTHMSTYPIFIQYPSFFSRLTVHSSPRHASAHLHHALPAQPRIQHHPIQPPQHPLHRPRHHHLTGLLLPQRDHRQSHRRRRSPAVLGFAAARCAVHVQRAHVAMGVLRRGHHHYRVSVRSSGTGCMGVLELV